ncbi:MAG: hypothetical protein LBB94_13220 [Clostridiales bacterium]|jgi:hypothetical protein|nr:hypothetical protein [Clostridiales bacterium]
MKERVKNVLNFKKPSRVIIIAAVTLVAVLSVGFAANRANNNITDPIDVTAEYGFNIDEATTLIEMNIRDMWEGNTLSVDKAFAQLDKTQWDRIPMVFVENRAETTSYNDETVQRVEEGLRVIMSSPLTSSNPQDYINEHNEEYENLTAKYPDGVLDYLLSQFEAGNTDGLRGQIMMRMCKDMLGLQNNVTDEYLSPQEWYKHLSIISEITLPDFKPDNPTGVYDGEFDGKAYGGIFNSAIMKYYGNSERGFLVYAPTIYGVYEESDKLKAFVTVYYQYYRLYGNTLENTGGGVIPGGIVFTKEDRTEGWVFEEYLEIGTAGMPDGMYYNDSIQKLCVMPVSGTEIKGLAEKMISDYTNNNRQEVLTQSLKEHLAAQGQMGVSLKTPGGEMIPLT